MKLSLVPWSDMSVRNKVIIICCGALILIIAFYFLICKPKAAATAALLGKLQMQQTVLQTAERELAEMPDPDGYYRQLQEEETRVQAMLPNTEAVSELLVVLNALGKERQVSIVGIKQNAFVDHKTYYEIPLEMTVGGTYPAVLCFMDKLESLPRFNALTKIGMQARENVLTVQLLMSVYVYGAMPPNAQAKQKLQR